jgi:hypothetical protein
VSPHKWNVEVELNGQENFRTGRDLELIQASPQSLRFVYRRGHGVHPGHVDDSQGRTVREVVVRYNLRARDFAYLCALVQMTEHDGCGVRISSRREADRGAFTPVVYVRS